MDHVNAHATSTPLGDAVEWRGIHSVLGNDEAVARRRTLGRPPVLVTSTKGAIGHLLGAAGAIEAAFAAMTVSTGVVPPNRNLQRPDFPLDGPVRLTSGLKAEQTSASPRVVLTNSFGFGGTNASLCLRSFQSNTE